MNFVAIDFETANSKRSSACAMGLVVVKNGQITDIKSWLMRPKMLKFDNINVYIHGITAKDVKDKPQFNELWKDIRPYLENQTVVAHNASFDMSVLRHVLDEYNLPYPTFNYLCTIAAAKSTWQGQSNNKLDTLANMLGINFKHHDACDDAIACAKVLIEALKTTSSNSIEEFCSSFKIKLGRIYGSSYEPCKQYKSKASFEKTMLNSIKSSNTTNNNPDLHNKKVIFTGPLRSMSRTQANQKVVSLGGISGYGVTKDTNYLVVGIRDYKTLSKDQLTTKLKKAYSYIERGVKIKIISEDDFLKML